MLLSMNSNENSLLLNLALAVFAVLHDDCSHLDFSERKGLGSASTYEDDKYPGHDTRVSFLVSFISTIWEEALSCCRDVLSRTKEQNKNT